MATIEPGRVRGGRASEFGLLVLALVLGMGAYAIVGLSMNGSVPANFYPLMAGMISLSFGMHLVVRWKAPFADPTLLPVAVALNGLGLAMIYRLDLGNQLKGSSADPLAAKQLGWMAVGMVTAAGVIWVLRDHRTLRRYTYTAMSVGLVLLVLPLIPKVGKEINGARIWIRFAGFSLQPAELAKICFAVFFAGYLVTNRDTLTLAGRRLLGMQLPRIRDLGPLVVVWLASIAVLILESDLGTSLLFFGLFLAMLYIATERISWVVIGLSMFAVGATFAALSFPHVQGRFNAWLHALDPKMYDKSFGGSFQLVQGMFSLANGGLTGTGWGEGRPDIVPFASSDFIYAALGEELGLTGLFAILLMYLLLVERGIRIAIGTRDGFGKLLAGGLAFVISWQVFVVVGGITRVIPITGLTMPFLAYGGSSLLANWIIVALLLRISDNARRPTPLPLRGAPESPTISQPADESASVDQLTEPPMSAPGRKSVLRDAATQIVPADEMPTCANETAPRTNEMREVDFQ